MAGGNGVEVNQDKCWSGIKAEKSSAVVLRKGGRFSETGTALVLYSRSISVFITRQTAGNAQCSCHI